MKNKMKKRNKNFLNEMVFGNLFGFIYWLILSILLIGGIVALIFTILGINIPYPNEW
jgi:hypothetical protein